MMGRKELEKYFSSDEFDSTSYMLSTAANVSVMVLAGSRGGIVTNPFSIVQTLVSPAKLSGVTHYLKESVHLPNM